MTPAKPAQTLSPFEELDRWFEGFYPRGWMRPLQMDWPSWGELSAVFEGRMPRVDVIDRDDEVIVRAHRHSTEYGECRKGKGEFQGRYAGNLDAED